MSECDPQRERQNNRTLAMQVNQSWRAIVEDDVPPVDKHVFIAAAESKWARPREAYSGLFYTLTGDAYREIHSGDETSLDKARTIFHEAAVSILRELVQKYDAATWKGKRDDYIGLINEFTPIALLNSPYASNKSVTMLASRPDDRYHKIDLYHLVDTGDYFPIQVKTDSYATQDNIPSQGVIIFGEDFLNFNKDLATTRALIKKDRSPENEQLLSDATEGLTAILKRRKNLRGEDVDADLKRINANNYTSSTPRFGPPTIGSAVPELAAFRDYLTSQQEQAS